MLDLFDTIIKNDSSTASVFFICLGASLILGLFVAFSFMYKNTYTKSFVISLAIIPSIVSLLILLINGNIGTGIGVAGAFSLVRFRSAAGTAREIGFVFLATSLGLAIGTGYIGIAFIFAVVVVAFTLLLTTLKFGESKACARDLKITIPESLDYTNVFDDIFEKYTTEHELYKVRTSNMGSLYRLHYRINIKDAKQEKEFIDELRVRNGNLDIICGRKITESDEAL